MKKFTPASIYTALGSEPSERKMLHLAAQMMREDKDQTIYRNNIYTLLYYMDIVRIGYNTGAFCNCFKN